MEIEIDGRAVLIDEIDAPLVVAHRWHINGNGYVIRCSRSGGKRVATLLHREITGAQPGQVVDHANGNPQDKPPIKSPRLHARREHEKPKDPFEQQEWIQGRLLSEWTVARCHSMQWRQALPRHLRHAGRGWEGLCVGRTTTSRRVRSLLVKSSGHCARY